MIGILQGIKTAKVQWKTLGEIASVQRGRVIAKKHPEDNNSTSFALPTTPIP